MKSKGYDGKMFQLINIFTGLPQVEGAELTDFRGDHAVLAGGRAPHKPSSNGHVSTATGGEYYASVFDLKWVEVK